VTKVSFPIPNSSRPTDGVTSFNCVLRRNGGEVEAFDGMVGTFSTAHGNKAAVPVYILRCSIDSFLLFFFLLLDCIRAALLSLNHSSNVQKNGIVLYCVAPLSADSLGQPCRAPTGLMFRALSGRR
jgi:hypothetical protein